jgi:putative esterase
MIVVMPLGYGTMEVIARGWSTWNDPELVRRNYSRFSDALLQEVMPLVKRQYPLSDKREDHAVAGLSMGGAESLLVGLNHIDDLPMSEASVPPRWDRATTVHRSRESPRAQRQTSMPGCDCFGLSAELKMDCSIKIRNSSPG